VTVRTRASIRTGRCLSLHLDAQTSKQVLQMLAPLWSEDRRCCSISKTVARVVGGRVIECPALGNTTLRVKR